MRSIFLLLGTGILNTYGKMPRNRVTSATREIASM